MTSEDYLGPYQRSMKQHGSDFDVTLWAGRDTQARRFEVFSEMCFLSNKRILDAGCSRGDFAEFLLQRDITYQQYTGVDALDEVIAFAKGRGLPGAEFHKGDFIADPQLLGIGQPQVICISGTLNTMTDPQVMAVLESAWGAASESLIFNFLSDCVGEGANQQTLPARRLDTRRWLAWALEKTWSVAFRQDYFEFGHDATILMRKSV